MKMLDQLREDKHSIIYQGDIFNQRRQMFEALRRANFDNNTTVNEQIWYDSLRGSDDGMYSTNYAGNDQLDYVDKRPNSRQSVVRNTVLKQASRNRPKSSFLSKEETKTSRNPFNSQNRTFFSLGKDSSKVITCSKLQKIA